MAQYGRGAGMIQDLASQIIGQFAKNLSKQIETSPKGATGNPPTEAKTSPADLDGGEPSAAPHQPAAPAQVGGMAFKVLWNQIVRSIKGLFGIKD